MRRARAKVRAKGAAEFNRAAVDSPPRRQLGLPVVLLAPPIGPGDWVEARSATMSTRSGRGVYTDTVLVGAEFIDGGS
ncbi:hypothetical protein C8Q77DRAFT_1159698 [Trametes polyzona]|nr:hypothetical protein C8Q77DRAFT_1159698 [Trametes polyzona]